MTVGANSDPPQRHSRIFKNERKYTEFQFCPRRFCDPHRMGVTVLPSQRVPRVCSAPPSLLFTLLASAKVPSFTISVHAGENLHNAIDRAQSHDTIALEADAQTSLDDVLYEWRSIAATFTAMPRWVRSVVSLSTAHRHASSTRRSLRSSSRAGHRPSPSRTTCFATAPLASRVTRAQCVCSWRRTGAPAMVACHFAPERRFCERAVTQPEDRSRRIGPQLHMRAHSSAVA